MTDGIATAHVSESGRSAPPKWLGPLLVVVGIALATIGLVNLRGLLAAPLEAQRSHLAQSLFPLIVGIWLFIGGAYAITRGRSGGQRTP